MPALTKCDVRMYRIGTGDCFVLSFHSDSGSKPAFKMMIDCGAQNGSAAEFRKHLDDLIAHVEGEIDVLVISHEHQDHVLGFQRCEKLLTDTDAIKFKEVWMAWTEEDGDPEVEEWKDEYGKKKNTLALASERLMKAKEAGSPDRSLFESIYHFGKHKDESFSLREDFIDTLADYTALNVDEAVPLGVKVYSGGLAGMKVVKEKVKRKQTRYLEAGTILDRSDHDSLENIRIHVLGPPKNWTDVKTEHGKDGETYKHNKELEMVRSLSAFDLDPDPARAMEDVPFAESFIDRSQADNPQVGGYQAPENAWRRIDFDWLFMAGGLSLRLTKGINNLSLVLAIEFVESGKVMLFPGDAEFGSWRSWHEIKWDEEGTGGKHLTEDLLNRTVFYKVAHHMSHNGTAKELGLEMMTSSELAAMGTVDYSVISKNWKNTMPNRGIVRDLLDKTKGKLMIMNFDQIFYDKQRTVPIGDEIKRRLKSMSKKSQKKYKKNLSVDDLYIEYKVDGS